MILAVTGHRPDKLGGWKVPNPTQLAVMDLMDQALLELMPDFVITGMSLGVDQWMAELCILNEIPFIAAVPFEGQEKVWPPHSQAKYVQLLSRAHETIFVSDPGYASWKLQLRNEWMVNKSDMLLAVFNGSSGGTANCVAYAKKQKRKIRFIDPPSLLGQQIVGNKAALEAAQATGHIVTAPSIDDNPFARVVNLSDEEKK